MVLKQELVQKLNQHQMLGVAILQMSTLELDTYLQNLSESNPVVELEEDFFAPETSSDSKLIQKLRWLEENDYQNRFYQSIDEDIKDPLATVSSAGGLEETLQRFLCRQIDTMTLSAPTTSALRYLVACLDDDGYLRADLRDLSRTSGIPMSCVKEACSILRTMDPAGVGASDLSQCLILQLQRMGHSGAVLEIVRHYLEPLAKHRYRAIAAQLGITTEQVQECERVIQQLNPRPGANFDCRESINYIQPDVIVTEEPDGFKARTRRSQRQPFHINAFYQDLLDHSDDPHVLEYLSEKVQQAVSILQAVEQRESTLQRCAQVIVDIQRRFFHQGPIALVPLRMADVAQSLGVHESTVSRAVREKYLQCRMGIFPMSYFFSRSSASAEQSGANVAARIRLRQLIDQEDKAHPLSDQKLCELLAQDGYTLSRRTVAKYREEMNIPGTSGRRRSCV